MRSAPRSRAAALVAALAAALALASPSAGPATAERPPAGAAADVTTAEPGKPGGGAGTLQHRVRYQNRTLSLSLRPLALRSPGFALLVQGADGELRRQAVRRTRAWQGRVRGIPGATAVAVRAANGALYGSVELTRGGSLRFAGSQVVETRGLEAPRTYAWPSSQEAERNVTVRRGQVGAVTRRVDLAFDLDASYLDSLRGSVPAAMTAVELLTAQLVALYERDARLRPALKRVVLRTSDAASPYAGVEGGDLTLVREAWAGQLRADVVDDVLLLHDEGGGGVAYVETAGTDYGVAVNGGGADVDVVRHELAHNWGPRDNHTNGPEGATVVSGNQYSRFDGTELSAILRYRDEELAEQPGRFPAVRTATASLPPYAALDLRGRLRSGQRIRLLPARNDHDANGDRVRLASVPARSRLGARLVRRGSQVVYRAPRVGAAGTLDWFTYQVTDGEGRTAVGVVLLRIAP